MEATFSDFASLEEKIFSQSQILMHLQICTITSNFGKRGIHAVWTDQDNVSMAKASNRYLQLLSTSALWHSFCHFTLIYTKFGETDLPTF